MVFGVCVCSFGFGWLLVGVVVVVGGGDVVGGVGVVVVEWVEWCGLSVVWVDFRWWW